MKTYSGYSYVQIKGKWYHLQDFAWDSIHNGTLAYPTGGISINRLDSVIWLTGGIPGGQAIQRVTDDITTIPPNAEGPAKPGWLLGYVQGGYSHKMRRAALRKLIAVGLRMPKRPGKGFLRYGLGIESIDALTIKEGAK